MSSYLWTISLSHSVFGSLFAIKITFSLLVKGPRDRFEAMIVKKCDNNIIRLTYPAASRVAPFESTTQKTVKKINK